MVSHQLVYVTGLLEVILTPSDPSGGCGRLRSFPGTRPDLAGVPDAPRGSCGRLQIYQGTRLMYPASLAGVPDAFHSSESDHGTALLEIKEGR